MRAAWGAVVLSVFWSQAIWAIDSEIALLKERLRGPAAGAHQGGLSSTRMNTLPNFESARIAGVRIVEMDLRISADGIPVVYHDEKLGFWTYCRNRVRERTVDQLKRDCQYKHGAIISTFDEILQWSQGRVVVNAEFKDPETVVPAIQLVQKYRAYSWVYFQTQGSWEKYLLARSTDSKVALLFSPKSTADVQAAIANTDPHLIIIEIDERWDSPETIEAIHQSGRLISIDSFDYDPLKEIFISSCYKAFAKGIDIAISNRPESCVSQAKRAFYI